MFPSYYAPTGLEQPKQPARTRSRLLDKARSMGLRLPLDLERLAILRGCLYYERDLPPRIPALGDIPLSNAELSIALISPEAQPSAREIRLAAALLGAPDAQASEIATLARDEACASVVRYIAECGHRFEPRNVFWSSLVHELGDVEFDPAKLPHPTRFVEMTGIDRGKIGLSTRWIRPQS